MNRRNVFICHASEDKDKVVRRLVKTFENNNISVWYDEAEIKWGESVSEKINEGIRISDYVLVVLSLPFLSRSWPQREFFAALSSDASSGSNRVLPLIVGSTNERSRILEEVPLLSDKLYLVWEDDATNVVVAMKSLLEGKEKPTTSSSKEKIKRLRRKMLMISSVSFSKKNFFPRLTTEIVTQGEDHDFDILIKMASSEADYRSDEQLKILHKLLRDQNWDFDVVCIIPTSPQYTTDMVIELMLECGRPVIAIDVRYEDTSKFLEHGLKPPPILQVDNIVGGQLAAEIMVDYFVKRNVFDPLVLTIQGPPKLKHSIDRVRGFESEMKKRLPKCKIYQLEPGNWLRERAEKSLDHFLNSIDACEFHGVFAGNDEMALGVRRSVLKHKRLDDARTPDIIKIVGFDNIAEMEELMMQHDSYIIGTIDQNLKSMASKLYDVIDEIEKGVEPPQEVLVKPIPIRAIC